MLVSDTSIDLASPVNRSGKDPTFVDFNLSPTLDDEFEIFGGRMSVPGGSSPFIKDEEQEDWFNQPINNNRNLSMHSNPGYGHVPHGSIDPSELSMGSHFSGFHQQHQSNPSALHMGSAIADDELLDLDLNNHAQIRHNPHGQDFYSQGQQIPQPNQGMHNMFSTNTPTGDPIQSPFLHGGFNYGNQQQPFGSHVSPGMRPSNPQDYGFGATRIRTSLPHSMDRKPSDTRSPLTPKTPGLAGLNLGSTPESGSLPQPISAISHRHQKSLSGQWDSTPGLSYVDSPTASPAQHSMNHAQISEVLKSNQALPGKIETHHNPTYQSQEAKRRRRRESHNMVERRRRDNINERIQELSHLVPQHRLEDEKVRKHLATNGPGPLSPTLAASGLASQPATSLLASGRRAASGAGNITMGIPMEDKDKGPNKGDILNGSVGWTRDLMWCLHTKLQQEAQLRELIATLGGVWPFVENDDERRMYTELIDAMETNDVDTFTYSRTSGSGLRVPKHTNLAGEPVTSPSSGMSPPSSVSPGVQIGPSSTHPGFWSKAANRGDFKEEDEYDMQL
ncbi:MAG: hypothetical protein GOMPHAMPRED_005616 [Gomphillus americanus]|uniref:BHLH domain-containing protein n=1 Tax=Gomphillus americanus TaxID=1940652 RepID=A0A8H3FSZ3_9LECA|nr:MAG: hypothetical protein GOMPHAMPRED_005616 [Gomphillus americanus]